MSFSFFISINFSYRSSTLTLICQLKNSLEVKVMSIDHKSRNLNLHLCIYCIKDDD